MSTSIPYYTGLAIVVLHVTSEITSTPSEFIIIDEISLDIAPVVPTYDPKMLSPSIVYVLISTGEYTSTQFTGSQSSH
jgi:hypothetical protein